MDKIELSTRFYNRVSAEYGMYRVEEYLGERGKTKVPYYLVKFKNTGNTIEAPLQTILADKVVDIEEQKKQTAKKNRAKKRELKQEKIQDKRYAKVYDDNVRLLALDASSHSTGYAVFINDDLVDYGYIYQPHSNRWDTSRINFMKTEIKTLVENYEVNVVAMEDIIHKSKVALYVLSKVQGVVMDYLFETNIDSCLITPIEWKSEYNINSESKWKGKNTRIQSKEKTLAKVNKQYSLNLEVEFADYPKDMAEPPCWDCADAIAIGTVAKKRIKKVVDKD